MPHPGVENRALSASSRSARSMNVSRLVVVGASLAGLRAVEAARKAGFEGAITLIGAERHFPYDRPPLSKDFLDAAKPDAEELIPFFRSDDVFADELESSFYSALRPQVSTSAERSYSLGAGRWATTP